MKYYGKVMFKGSVRAARSFGRRSVKFRTVTKEKGKAVRKAISRGINRYL